MFERRMKALVDAGSEGGVDVERMLSSMMGGGQRSMTAMNANTTTPDFGDAYIDRMFVASPFTEAESGATFWI